MVERHVANVNVDGSNPFTRFEAMASRACSLLKDGFARAAYLVLLGKSSNIFEIA